MHEEAWRYLVTAALLGTARQPFTLPAADGPPGMVLAALDPADPERALLDAAAALVLYREAGALPLPDDHPLPEACALDDLPRASGRAGELLASILDMSSEPLLAEWLTLAAQAGQRAPEEYLPTLLHRGRGAGKEALRRAILPVLGGRGRWLAAHNPDWQYAAADTEKKAGRRAARARESSPKRRRADPESLELLLAALSPERREVLALTRLEQYPGPFREGHPALDVLRLLRHPWSADLTRAVLERLRRTLTTRDARPDAALREATGDFAFWMSPALAREAEAVLSLPTSADHLWRRVADEAIAILFLRYEMHQEFAR